LRELIIHLLEAIAALVITPIHKHRPMIDPRAVISSSFKADTCFRQGRRERTPPGRAALGPICAEDDHCTAVAVAITPGCVLSGIPNVKDAVWFQRVVATL